MSKFYCSTHNKYKAIPRQKYAPHDRVQYIRKGSGGHPATTAKGTVEVVLGNDVYVLTDSSKRVKLTNSLESITPEGAPSPLQYINPGKCWCEIVEEAESVQQDGAV